MSQEKGIDESCESVKYDKYEQLNIVQVELLYESRKSQEDERNGEAQNVSQ